MTDGEPLWLRIAIALIPLAGTLIAAYFAQVNTVNRRIERLRNLSEIRKDFPDWLNPDYALEQVILRELRAIDFATTPIYIWYKRFAYIVGLIGSLTWALIVLEHFGRMSAAQGSVLQALISVVSIFFTVPIFFLQKRVNEKLKRYKRQFETITNRAQQDGERRSDEGTRQDTPQSVVADVGSAETIAAQNDSAVPTEEDGLRD